MELRYTSQKMEQSENVGSISSTHDEFSAKKADDTEPRLHGNAVEIIDHYAIKCDTRKLSDCSDPLQPTRPPRKSGDFLISSIPTSRKASGSLDSSPIKPSRKLSQSSREFAASSDNISIRTPKKVSFSDELPMTSSADKKRKSIDSDGLSTKSTDETIQMASERLESMYSGSLDSDRSSNDSTAFDRSVSSTIATQTANELTKADMFPNSRKVSLHSERSFDMGGIITMKPGTESAATQITTDTETESGTILEQFIDNERRLSTTSVRSKQSYWLSKLPTNLVVLDVLFWFIFLFFFAFRCFRPYLFICR